MKVHELIKRLSVLPQDMEVLRPGYESGYELVDDATVKTTYKVPGPWYEGTYQELAEYHETSDLPKPRIVIS